MNTEAKIADAMSHSAHFEAVITRNIGRNPAAR